MIFFKKTVQHLYNRYLDSLSSHKNEKFYSIFYRSWNKFFKKYDPEIEIRVGKKNLFLNLSHKLPIFYRKYPNYDRALPRVCKKISEIDGQLNVIDIGANIGDTVSLITDEVTGNFLCIDGDKKYLPVLEKNIEKISKVNKVKIVRCYCGNSIKDESISIDRIGGTAKIITTSLSNNKKQVYDVEIKSLDEIMIKNPDFQYSNLLKIDTDGFEINILESGSSFIKKLSLLYILSTHLNYIYKIIKIPN
ncbi:MAG: FkbM family methyltransferase [Candidatus Staskawiczbacteria bacterium]